MIGTGFISDDEASDSDSDSSDSGDRRRFRRKRVVHSPTDYKNKEDSAEDYFDITELADEAPAEVKDSREDYDDIEEAIPAAKVTADGAEDSSHTGKNGEATDDKELMPPPPQNAAPSIKQDDDDKASTSDGKSKKIFIFHSL